MSVATIREGDYAIFDEHGEKKSIYQVRANGTAKVGKFHIPVGQLVGAPWGSSYRLAADGSRLIPVTEHEPVLPPLQAKAGCDGDNSTLVDANQRNQQLTAGDIDRMRAEGKSGDDILAALCSNSTTFDSKTEFAQAKYKKKKARKYNTILTLLQPNSWHICQVSFDKSPSSVWNLRPDSLALLLSLANVAAHSRTLLLENCQGLLAAACAERLGGHGVLCCVGTGDKQAPLTGLRLLNLDQQHKGIVCTAQLAELQSAHQVVQAKQQQQQQGETVTNGIGEAENGKPQSEATATAAANGVTGTAAGCHVAGAAMAVERLPVGVPVVATMDVDKPQAADIQDEQPVSKRQRQEKSSSAAAASQQQQQEQQREQGAMQQQQQHQGQAPEQSAGAGGEAAAAGTAAGDSWAASGAAAGGFTGRRYAATAEELEQLLGQGGFTSCIIAAPRLQPTAIVTEVLPLLAPASPFVVFSPWLQPLAEAHQLLTSTRQAVLLQLQETWLRPYQVLPGRTHPHMNMTTGGTGGYVLSGTTVARDHTAEASGSGDAGREGELDKDNKSGAGRGGGRGAGAGGKRGRGKRR